MRDHLFEMERRMERLDLRQQILDEALARHHRMSGNVVDRLFGIKLGALAAGARKDIDQVALNIEKPQFEHREQARRARANDNNIRFDRLFHSLLLKMASYRTMVRASHQASVAVCLIGESGFVRPC